MRKTYVMKHVTVPEGRNRIGKPLDMSDGNVKNIIIMNFAFTDRVYLESAVY